MLYILDWMEELKARLLSEDYGKHLMGVEDLIQVSSLVAPFDVKLILTFLCNSSKFICVT